MKSFGVFCIGESGAGKTAIIHSFMDKPFSNTVQNTVGIEMIPYKMKFSSKTIKFIISDTSGQEKFNLLSKNYYKPNQGFLLVYDITSRASFKNIDKWLNGIKENMNMNYVSLALIGNKIDLESSREVTFEEGKQFAIQNNCLFIETSAKTGKGIKESFFTLFEQILELRGQKPQEFDDFINNLPNKIDRTLINNKKEIKEIIIDEDKDTFQIGNQKEASNNGIFSYLYC